MRYRPHWDPTRVLGDEVVLLFGVESWPEAFENKDELGREINGEIVDYMVNSVRRENTVMFSAHFSERMKCLNRLLTDEPLVRAWAGGDPTDHNMARLYGVAVRKKLLPTVLNKIRDNKIFYWEGKTTESNAHYVIDVDTVPGEWNWRDLKTGKLFRPFDTPEWGSVPEMLVQDHELDIKWKDEGAIRNKILIRQRAIALREMERIVRIIRS